GAARATKKATPAAAADTGRESVAAAKTKPGMRVAPPPNPLCNYAVVECLGLLGTRVHAAVRYRRDEPALLATAVLGITWAPTMAVWRRFPSPLPICSLAASSNSPTEQQHERSRDLRRT